MHTIVMDGDFSAAILDQLAIPVLLADPDAAILYTNNAARTVLDDHGLALSDGNILGTAQSGDDNGLKAAIADTCASKVGRIVGIGTDQRIVAIVLPFPEKSKTAQALIVLRNGTGNSGILLNSLRRFFKLSSAEAAIAISLSTGADLNEVARERGVTLNTLRSQVASIMARTGTHRQAELVALVARIDNLLQAGFSLELENVMPDASVTAVAGD